MELPDRGSKALTSGLDPLFYPRFIHGLPGLEDPDPQTPDLRPGTPHRSDNLDGCMSTRETPGASVPTHLIRNILSPGEYLDLGLDKEEWEPPPLVTQAPSSSFLSHKLLGLAHTGSFPFLYP